LITLLKRFQDLVGIDSDQLSALPFSSCLKDCRGFAAQLAAGAAQQEQSGLGSHGLSTRADTDHACGLPQHIFRKLFFDPK